MLMISWTSVEGISIGDNLFDHFSNEEFRYAEKTVIFKQKIINFTPCYFINYLNLIRMTVTLTGFQK